MNSTAPSKEQARQLWRAIVERDHDALKNLLAAGANPNACLNPNNKKGVIKSALGLALRRNLTAADALFDAGATIREALNHGETFESLASIAGSFEDCEAPGTEKRLTQAFFAPDVPPGIWSSLVGCGWTLLTFLCVRKAEDEGPLREALRMGADPNARALSGESPLEHCAGFAMASNWIPFFVTVIQELALAGGDVLAERDGQTLERRAQERAGPEIAAALRVLMDRALLDREACAACSGALGRGARL
jgi:ankyrin repeat protein